MKECILRMFLLDFLTPNPLSANPTKWSNALKQLSAIVSVFGHFVGLALKGLISKNPSCILHFLI